MFKFNRFWSGIFLSGLTASLMAASPAEFFAPALDHAAKLPKHQVYPAGRLFPFAGFQPHDVKFFHERNFTLIGPAYGGNIPRMLERAKQLNMPVIYPLNAVYKGKKITLKNLSDPSFILDEKAVTRDLTRQVKQAMKQYPNIAWWYIQPEELRFWRKKEYRYLQIATAAIRAADPLKRPVWMYNPGHYPARHLAKYAKYLDILGKGMYTNYSGFAANRVWVRHSCESQNEAIKLAKSRTLPLAVPEMFQNPPPGVAENIASWVRHDTYLALLSGSKGVVIFSLAERPSMRKDIHTKYLKAYLQLAAELNGTPELGQIFLFGDLKKIIKGQVIQGSPKVSCRVKGSKITYDSIKFNEYNHVSGRYLFAVNSADAAVTYQFSNLPQVKLAVVDAVTKQNVLITDKGQFTVNFAPLEVKLFKLIRQ